jgi:hypothetical protein
MKIELAKNGTRNSIFQTRKQFLLVKDLRQHSRYYLEDKRNP